MRQKILRLYRFLRHPKHRSRSRVHDWIARHVFDRELWNNDRSRVAGGTACGLFVCMLPIPLQTFVAVFIASKMRWNIPTAVLYCWVTSPLTWPITYAPAILLGIKITGVDIGMDDDFSFNAKEFTDQFWSNSAELIWATLVGCVIVGAAFAIVGYFSVHLWYALRGIPDVARRKLHVGKPRKKAEKKTGAEDGL